MNLLLFVPGSGTKKGRQEMGRMPKRRKKLTPRHDEVNQLSRSGLGSEQIATKLKLKVKTVERLLHDVMVTQPKATRPLYICADERELLTPTESKVLELRAKGLQYGEIAQRLNRGLETVKSHLRSAARKGIRVPRVRRYI